MSCPFFPFSSSLIVSFSFFFLFFFFVYDNVDLFFFVFDYVDCGPPLLQARFYGAERRG